MDKEKNYNNTQKERMFYLLVLLGMIFFAFVTGFLGIGLPIQIAFTLICTICIGSTIIIVHKINILRKEIKNLYSNNKEN